MNTAEFIIRKPFTAIVFSSGSVVKRPTAAPGKNSDTTQHIVVHITPHITVSL